MMTETTTTPVHYPTTWEEFSALARKYPDAICVTGQRKPDYFLRARCVTRSGFDSYVPWTVVLPPPPPPEPLPEWAADDVCMVRESPHPEDDWWVRETPTAPWRGEGSGLITTELVERLRGREVTVIGRFVDSEARQ